MPPAYPPSLTAYPTPPEGDTPNIFFCHFLFDFGAAGFVRRGLVWHTNLHINVNQKW